jgi:hypothetical protein
MHNFSQIEVKESQNASSILILKLALMISDLDLFTIVLGHVCADVTLASQDRWELLETDGVLSIGITPGKL